MKAQELMLGDYVTFKECQKDTVPTIIKIWQINGDNDALVSIDNDDTLDEIAIDDEIVGITLTPEILEKNGFIKRGSWWYIPNTPRLDMGILGFGIDDGCGTGFSLMPNGDFVFFSKYVHEIQHCLRMVHIEKEIVL